MVLVAPARERGLKLNPNNDLTNAPRRSREGAWIEILLTFGKLSALIVAPARERGLKF